MGCCITPLHPLGSLEDQAYILNDAAIELLVFEPVAYGKRAEALKQAASGCKNFLAFGNTQLGEDLASLAEALDPVPLSAPDIRPTDVNNVVYTGGTTGKPKALSCHHSLAYMTMMQMAEWDVPSGVRFLVVTLSHAGLTCIVPTLEVAVSM